MTMIRWAMVLGYYFVMAPMTEPYYRCHDFRHTP